MAATGPTASMQTYRGACACGAFQFNLTRPTITGALACNCSFCSRTGTVLVSMKAPGTVLRVTRGSEDALGSYAFGSQHVDVRFCVGCGTSIIARVGGQPYLINIRTLEGIDLETLPVEKHNGAAKAPLYVPHPYTGPELPPSRSREQRQVYTGGCHCGAVTVALSARPSQTLSGSQCDCDTCRRKNTISADVEEHDLRVHVDPARTGALATRAFTATGQQQQFCQICSVTIHSRHSASLPSAVRLNLRILEDVPLDQLPVQKASCTSPTHAHL